MSSMRLKVLLDSIYLLPSFGIEVIGLTEQHIMQLRKIVIEKLVRYYYALVS